MRYLETGADGAGHLTLLAPDAVWISPSQEAWLVLTGLVPEGILSPADVRGQVKQLEAAQHVNPVDAAQARSDLLAYLKQAPAAPQAQPREIPITCPHCGAPVQADSREKCAYCGHLL